MRILYLSPRRCWPALSGGNLRDYHLATQLAKRASVTYLSVCLPEDPPDADGGLPDPTARFERNLILPLARRNTLLNLLRGTLGPRPVSVLNWSSTEAEVILADLCGEMLFDSVQVEGPHLISYIPVLRGALAKAPIVCDWHDMLSIQMGRYAESARGLKVAYARRTAELLEREERHMLQLCDAHTVVSVHDRDQLASQSPHAEFHIVENGVDLGYFAEASGVSADRNRVLFVGAMDFFANADAAEWFTREGWPSIRAKIPDAVLTLVGRNPSHEVRALGREPGVEVTGTVADIRPYYREAFAAIVPLRAGSGTRLKILEAMAAGVPVVSTPIGAEGLDATNGTDILIAESAKDVSAAVVRLRQDSSFAQGLAERGRTLVSSRYGWDQIGARLFALHQRLHSDRG